MTSATLLLPKSSKQKPARILMMAASGALFVLLSALFSVEAAGTYEKPSPKPSPTKHAEMIKAEGYLADDNYRLALQSLAIVVKDEPKNADAWNLTGYSNRKLGNYEDSEAAYERALTLDPKHTRAMEYMGELYLTLGQLDKAEALLRRLNKLCFFNCKDRDMLKEAIAAYKAQS